MNNPYDNCPFPKNQTEAWKDIANHEGSYQVSSLGRVRSLDRVLSDGRTYTGRLLKPGIASHGYPTVNLSNKGVVVNMLVHRLVLDAFIGPCPAGLECCHRDGDRTNPRLNNLRWDTSANNYKDSVRHGTYSHGSRHGHAKLCELDVWLIRNINATSTVMAEFFDVSTTTIIDARNRRTWNHVQ